MTPMCIRLKEERNKTGLNQTDFAAIGGVTKKTQMLYEKGKSSPSAQYLAAVAGIGADVKYIITGERESNAQASADAKKSSSAKPGRGLIAERDKILSNFKAGYLDKDEFAEIPLYDVQASAGHGSFVEDEQVDRMLIFRKDWIRNELHVNPKDLYLVSVQGDSMYPTISPNDVILVHDDKDGAIVPCDGIYLLRLDDSLLVKRLQRKPNNRVVVMSDNPSYAPYEVDVDDFTDADFCIIGRVVWSGRKM